MNSTSSVQRINNDWRPIAKPKTSLECVNTTWKSDKDFDNCLKVAGEAANKGLVVETITKEDIEQTRQIKEQINRLIDDYYKSEQTNNFRGQGQVLFRLHYLQETMAKMPPIKRRDLEAVKSINGDIDVNKAQQNMTGDCWLIASIISIASNPQGKAILKQSIHREQNGNITVTLKGANKKYTFTPYQIASEINLCADLNVRVLEMALRENRKSWLDKAVDMFTTPEHNPDKDKLVGGFFTEPFELLTGKKVERAVVYHTRSKFVDNILNPITSAPMKKLLEQKQANPNRFILACGFLSANNKVEDQHAYSIKKVDKDYVTIVDPRHSSKEIKLSRKEFLSNVRDITSIDMQQ